MDFDLDPDQEAVMGAVSSLLTEHAGAARAIELQAEGRYDDALHAALASAGFIKVSSEAGMGLLEAALVTESIARAGGVVSAGACALVATATPQLDATAAIAIVDASAVEGPIRFANSAKSLLVVGVGAASIIDLEPVEVETVASNFGYPMGRLRGSEPAAVPLGDSEAARVCTLWRLALAAETVGTMDAALGETVAYLKQRRQFGRAIGSFQAVQHRLADCAIRVEAARWLMREAAHHDAPEEAVAAAASFAISAADRVFAETHQLSGAIGFTREHDLHVWSMRLQVLRLELGGLSGHRRALATARWGVGAA